jgi:hypothetical protein
VSSPQRIHDQSFNAALTASTTPPDVAAAMKAMLSARDYTSA